ncbi:MAG: hypothetical protein KDA87_06575, partial [Planctomycetales bacterium]|nr:hypothetical protein [Planctomycetales bacterium]
MSPLLVRMIILLVVLSGTFCTNIVAQPNPVMADVWEPFPQVAQLEPRQLIAPQPAVSPTLYPNEQRVRIYPRGSAGWQGRWFPGNAGERIAVIDSGVNIVINNVSGFSAVEISTDRLVVWTTDDAMGGLQLDGGDDGSVQPADVPLELYMEGNIVFQEGERIIFADRMYYNVQTRSGVILNSEMLTSMAGYRGKVRLKAEVLQQVDPNHFQGFNAGFTTSRLGVPRYWLQSGEFLFEDIKRPVVDPITGYPASDPFTGEPLIEPERQVVSRNNRVYLNEWPVFAWPSISTDLNRPTFYLESFSINNDSVFGTQVLSEWNLYQLLGFKNPPKGTTWTGSVDYLSERGLGLGTNFRYSRPGFLGHAGNTRGFIDVWGINDNGLDNLGADRRALVPEEDFRGRIFGRHRQDLEGGFRVTGEVGWVSDRNFLEQYYEQEWDNLKDQSTGVELKRTIENRSWSIAGEMQVNDFFTQTEWLPRLDHYWLGQPVFGDWLTWHEHSSIGYGHLRTADAPLDPADARKFDPLAWEADAEGLRAVSRQEISAPLLLGPFKFAPYALGEAAYWHEDLSANELERMYGQLGVRASIPFWRVNPAVQSQLFNLNGLAHKIVYEAEFFWAEADQDFQQLPLYDPLDDDSVEFFRRRFFFDTFNGVAGGDVPLEFDERTYALRSGMQGWVTSPSAE